MENDQDDGEEESNLVQLTAEEFLDMENKHHKHHKKHHKKKHHHKHEHVDQIDDSEIEIYQ
jgi:hypothetical protein